MYEDPSPEPSRGGLIARILAAIGCAAAGVFAFLWLGERDALRVERERFQRELAARQSQAQVDVGRAVRERVNKEVAAERARHARELAGVKKSRGTALEQRFEKLGEEHERLLGSDREAGSLRDPARDDHAGHRRELRIDLSRVPGQLRPPREDP